MIFRKKTKEKKAEEKAVKELLANIQKKESREQALLSFREQGAGGVEKIAAILDRMTRKDLRFSIALRKMLLISIPVSAVFFSMMIFSNARTHSKMSSMLWTMFSLQMFTPSIVVGFFSWTMNRNSLAAFLAELDDIHAVGPLCEALNYGERETRKVVSKGLQKILPRMKASDAALLNAEQRRSLYRTLGKNGEEWNVTVLQALEQIGDASAVPFVLPLTKSRNIAIQKAACDCLPYLQDREAQERLSRNLLRPSSAEARPDTLLRPAQSPPEHPPAQLLRAANPNAGDEK